MTDRDRVVAELVPPRFLRGLEQTVKMASYDLRMIEAARRLAIPVYEL